MAASSNPRVPSCSGSFPSDSARSNSRKILPNARLVRRERPLVSPFQKGSLAPSAGAWVTITESLSWRTIRQPKEPSMNLSPIWDS